MWTTNTGLWKPCRIWCLFFSPQIAQIFANFNLFKNWFTLLLKPFLKGFEFFLISKKQNVSL